MLQCESQKAYPTVYVVAKTKTVKVYIIYHYEYIESRPTILATQKFSGL